MVLSGRDRTAFNGRPDRAAESEAAFWRSMEELLPVLEREGIALNLEAHPDDFCEENTPAVDLVRAVNKPWVNYLCCAPHSFHLAGASDVGADIAATRNPPRSCWTASARSSPRNASDPPCPGGRKT
ncbi:TIM barrel protein, partial [Streptomyces mirabilis]|uniref:TIM barrel protein n=1 Tax=Streptomyces mirabilis TaxID=68239 RepID=UPI003694E76B